MSWNSPRPGTGRQDWPSVRQINEQDVQALQAFLGRYRAVYPDAKLASAEFYLNYPGLGDGKNVYGALDAQSQIVGLAPVLPVIEENAAGASQVTAGPLQIWTVVLAAPQAVDGHGVRGALLDQVLAQAAEIRNTQPARPAWLLADMMVSQVADVEYLLGHDFRPAHCVWVMERPLTEVILPRSTPAGITVRRWCMPSEAEQRAYLHSYNDCFPDAPHTLETLQFLLGSSAWSKGVAIAAFDEESGLVGSVLAYPDGSGTVGTVDDVFVLSAWRERGLARCLVAGALEHLREQGATTARLEVRADNAPALAVYRGAGFVVVAEEVILQREL